MAAPYVTPDDLTAETHSHIEPQIVDVIYESDAALYYLLKYRMKNFDGGRDITLPINTGQLRGAAAAPGSPIDLSPVNTTGALTFNPKWYWVNVTLPGYTLALNRGSLEMALDIVVTKLFEMSLQMGSLIATDLYGDGQNVITAAYSIDGLKAAVDSGVNFPVWGNQTRAAISNVPNQGINAYYKNVNGPLTLPIIQQAFAASTKPPGSPTYMICNTDVWAILWNHYQIFERQMRPEVGDKLDLGPQAMSFNGKPVGISNYAPLGTLWGLYHKLQSFWTSSAKRYRFGFNGWSELPGADAVAGRLQWIGDYTDTGCRYEFQLTGITG